MPVIPTLGKWGQVVYEVEGSLGYIASFSQSQLHRETHFKKKFIVGLVSHLVGVTLGHCHSWCGIQSAKLSQSHILAEVWKTTYTVEFDLISSV